jgi:hypothetical protein
MRAFLKLMEKMERVMMKNSRMKMKKVKRSNMVHVLK